MTKKTRLIVQPGEGITPLLEGIQAAKKTIDILIFRFDEKAVERALVKAVERGVKVRALIAHTNRGGDKNLRALEMRLLGVGITVSRTAEDLMRYHGKMIIVDNRELYLLAFNFTKVDINRSRSFAIITKDSGLVKEAAKLFEADTQRQPYSAGSARFIVSPINARQRLGAFIKAAKKELLIYDPNLSDGEMLKLLGERIKAGVSVRLIGKTKRGAKLPVHKLANLRLHTRSMVRDGADVFMGSQSLREAELDRRREVGIVVRDARIASLIAQTFNSDWEGQKEETEAAAVDGSAHAEKAAKKMAKAVTKNLPAVAPMVKTIVKELAGDGIEVQVNAGKLEDTVKDAVKEAVKDAVREAVK